MKIIKYDFNENFEKISKIVIYVLKYKFLYKILMMNDVWNP